MKRIFILLLCLSFLPYLCAKADTFYTLERQELSYDEVIASSKTVLFFWTTWCPYCLKELLRLNKNCPFFDDVNFLYINVGEGERLVRRASQRLKLTQCVLGKILLDKEAFIPQKFLVLGVPAFVFLKEGVVVYRSRFISKRLIKKVFKDE